MRSRFLSELTAPEVATFLKQGGKAAFLPVGCTEMHGPHMPIGTDTLIARAVALRFAEAAEGLVLPDIAYTWSGATDGFPGTISLPPELVIETATHVLDRCWKMGFRRLVLVSMHGRNQEPLVIVTRRLYETHGIPALYANPWHATSPEADALLNGKWATGKEASLTLAALHILGQSSLYSEKEMAYDAAPPARELIHSMDFRGTVGFAYQDLRHHVCPTRYTSLKRALKFVDLQIAAHLPGIANLDTYARGARRQKNQGWGRTQALT